MTKGMYKMMNEGILQLFGYMERIKNNRIAKRLYVRECVGSKTRKRWFDTVNYCL